MRRRDVLKTVPAAGAAVGLAGCSSILGGCSAPSGSASDALPDGTDQLDRQGGGGNLQSSTPDNAESSALAVYTDGNKPAAVFTVTKYNDESTAQSEVEDASSSGGGQFLGGDSVVGVLQVGAFAASVIATDESTAESLVEASAFGGGCTGELEYLGN
jgi:hypothetical protein